MMADDMQFDIDNRDIEEEMLMADIEDEENAQLEQDENEEAEESSKTAKKLRETLTLRNLDLDLSVKNEDGRVRYSFKKGDFLYYGYVISKVSKDKFVFNVKLSDSNDYKLKMFNFSDIK